MLTVLTLMALSFAIVTKDLLVLEKIVPILTSVA